LSRATESAGRPADATGFCDASLTHGAVNGRARFPDEFATFPQLEGIGFSLARADRCDGHRNLWLRALDAAGLGFDS